MVNGLPLLILIILSINCNSFITRGLEEVIAVGWFAYSGSVGIVAICVGIYNRAEHRLGMHVSCGEAFNNVRMCSSANTDCVTIAMCSISTFSNQLTSK
jgi:hypothetical protein